MVWLDIFMLIVVVASLIRGFISGLVMQLASLVGLILGAIFAGTLSTYICPWLLRLTGGNPHVIAPLSYIISFVIILLIIYLIGRIIQSFIKVVRMGTLNRIGGAVFCCLKWVVVFSIILALLVEFDINSNIISPKIRKNSQAYPVMMRVAREVIPFLSFSNYYKKA